MSQHKMLSEPIGLAVLDTSPFVYPNWLIINRLNVPAPHRRKGIATELLQSECDAADINRTMFGFKDYEQSGMIRKPK